MMTPGGPEPNQTPESSANVRSHKPLAANDGAGIALALGGGFSRGFAHLGVLEVLEQERIPVSAIVGTSIGGLLGAAYADGISVQELCELGRNVRVRDFIRFHRQDVVNQGNDRIGRFVREWFRARRVEELPIPTAIVTTDLSTCAPYIFTHGPLEVAIRATCAFPGLFNPIEHEGRLLADGCIVSPVPAAVAARMKARCVLGVSVGSDKMGASSGRKLVQFFNKAKVSSRNLVEPSWTKHADILLEPKVHQIDWNDFSRVDEARAAGAAAMRRALPSVRKLLDRQSQLRRVAGTTGHAENRVAF
jgi:NTE family protein